MLISIIFSTCELHRDKGTALVQIQSGPNDDRQTVAALFLLLLAAVFPQRITPHPRRPHFPLPLLPLSQLPPHLAAVSHRRRRQSPPAHLRQGRGRELLRRVPLPGLVPIQLRGDGEEVQGLHLPRRRSQHVLPDAEESHRQIRQRGLLLQKHQRESVPYVRFRGSRSLLRPRLSSQDAWQSNNLYFFIKFEFFI